MIGIAGFVGPERAGDHNRTVSPCLRVSGFRDQIIKYPEHFHPGRGNTHRSELLFHISVMNNDPVTVLEERLLFKAKPYLLSSRRSASYGRPQDLKIMDQKYDPDASFSRLSDTGRKEHRVIDYRKLNDKDISLTRHGKAVVPHFHESVVIAGFL